MRDHTTNFKFRPSLWQQSYLYMMDEKMNSSSEDEVLELEEDIYCFTYLEIIKEDDPKIHRELMLKCVLAFMMQIILCYCVLGETINIFEA